MTQEEFKTYSELQVKFAEDVDRVTNFLCKIDYSLNYITEYYLENGTVFTHGWEYWSYGGQEEHTSCFDADMLTWSDDKLKKYVDDILAERERERIKKVEETEKKKEEEDRKTWERLNEKFGKK